VGAGALEGEEDWVVPREVPGGGGVNASRGNMASLRRAGNEEEMGDALRGWGWGDLHGRGRSGGTAVFLL